MKSILLSISILFFTTTLFAQNDATPSDNDKISYGIGVNIKQPQLPSDNSDLNISNKIGYSFEGNFYFDLKPRLTLKAGLNFTSFQFEFTESVIFGTNILNPSGPSSYFKNKVNWAYAGFPIELQFNIVRKKHQVYLKAGGEVMFNIYKKHQGEISESGIVRETDTSNLNTPSKAVGLGIVGLGMNIHLTEKMKLYIEPNLEFGLNSALAASILSNEYKGRFNTIGCKLGVRF